jgi:hypothetical protein
MLAGEKNWRGELWCFSRFLRKTVCGTWCFDGVIVVNCVVNVVFKHRLFRALEMRQLFQLYFVVLLTR